MMSTNFLCKMINAFFLFVFVLIGSSIALAQVRKTLGAKKPVAAPVKAIDSVKMMERPVTVTFKEGEPVSGKLVNATAEGVQIVLAGNTLLLKWSDIAKITFTDVVIAQPLPKAPSAAEKNTEAIANALKALRKLSSATEVGVNFQVYSGRIIDVKTEINEILPDISEGNEKNEIILAMETYADAGSLWNGYIQDKYYSVSSAAKLLLKKYSMSYDTDGNCIFESSCVLPRVWEIAKKHLENASKVKVQDK